MHPFHRRRNCNGNDEYGKGHGMGRQRALIRNDQGEPTLLFDDKFNYIQKEPAVYQANKVDSTLTEKENILRASVRDNIKISTDDSISTTHQHQSCKGPNRTLNPERST